ncbi:MAG: cytochrome c3 family protein [Ignavibacteria bacterium]|nr:cytochrome c3 family protein [Ignavibacteria bacterium]
MEEETVKVKKKKWLFPKSKGFKRFSYLFVLWFVVFIIVLAATAEYTSRPSFCPTCHYMEPFYQSWKTSSHNKVQCVQCHFEPGLEGKIKGKLNGLVQIVSYVSTSYKKRKPWADIPDNTCSRPECHASQSTQDTVYETKGILFNHKHHLQELRRGKKLKCTSCHSQIVQGSHMQVTYSTCFNCHFHKSDDPEHKYDKLANCTTCHNLEKKSKEQLAAMKYNHTAVLETKTECSSCHTNIISGKGEVGKERCFQCHFEDNKLDKYSDTEFMHKTHIAKHSMNCMYCHTPIKHKIEKMDINSPPDCQSCHTGAHTYQLNLFAGEKGFNTESTPSSMFQSGINCQGCHILHQTSKRDIGTKVSSQDACDKCHGAGYGKLIKLWEASSIKRLAEIKSIYATVNSTIKNSSSSRKNEAMLKLDEAMHNIKTVDIGKSVHNIQFADKLLVGSYGIMKEALEMIGSTKKLPDFKSSSNFVPNECYNCHAGIESISKTIFGKTFSHNTHIVKQKLQCDRCHTNEGKHGKLFITKDGCNSCHHTDAKSSDACTKCHSLQTQVYNGNYEGRNTPDIMKTGGVGCIDCHNEKGKVEKPNEKICAKCHDAGYSQMMLDWKSDIKALSGTLNDMLSKNSMEITGDQSAINDAKALVKSINGNPSLYVHNYDLLSTLLAEKKKKLGKQ